MSDLAEGERAMTEKFEATMIRLCRDQIAACQAYLLAVGADVDPLYHAASRVVWARYYSGDDGWDRLKKAIGQLEEIVGRPEREV